MAPLGAGLLASTVSVFGPLGLCSSAPDEKPDPRPHRPGEQLAEIKAWLVWKLWMERGRVCAGGSHSCPSVGMALEQQALCVLETLPVRDSLSFQ